jgi:hypothetical protein
MSKTVQKDKSRKKDAWLDDVIERVRPILRGIEESLFTKYRSIGRIVLESGYVKGTWHSYHKQYFMKELKVDRSTFSLFIRLAEMTDEAFKDTVATYPSIREWYTKGKPKSMSEQRRKLLRGLIQRFPNQAKEIAEILRIKQPYLTEKELSEFNNLIIRSRGSTPLEVFIQHYYLTKDSTSKIPTWILIGFNEYAERKGLAEGVLGDTVIRKLLQDILKQEGITKEVIAKRAKLKLKMEWG